MEVFVKDVEGRILSSGENPEIEVIVADVLKSYKNQGIVLPAELLYATVSDIYTKNGVAEGDLKKKLHKVFFNSANYGCLSVQLQKIDFKNKNLRQISEDIGLAIPLAPDDRQGLYGAIFYSLYTECDKKFDVAFKNYMGFLAKEGITVDKVLKNKKITHPMQTISEFSDVPSSVLINEEKLGMPYQKLEQMYKVAESVDAKCHAKYPAKYPTDGSKGSTAENTLISYLRGGGFFDNATETFNEKSLVSFLELVADSDVIKAEHKKAIYNKINSPFMVDKFKISQSIRENFKEAIDTRKALVRGLTKSLENLTGEYAKKNSTLQGIAEQYATVIKEAKSHTTSRQLKLAELQGQLKAIKADKELKKDKVKIKQKEVEIARVKKQVELFVKNDNNLKETLKSIQEKIKDNNKKLDVAKEKLNALKNKVEKQKNLTDRFVNNIKSDKNVILSKNR